MKDWVGSDITLPEITAGADAGSQPSFCLSILYHPDTDRIGERALLDLHHGTEPVSLCRYSPGFASADRAEYVRGLDDPYISRDVLSFELDGSRIRLSLGQGSSSVTLNGVRIDAGTDIALARLRKEV